MNRNSLVSIVIPVYKVEECLSFCLDSLLRQTYDNIEIICVDDGSPDECPVILDQYAERDKRIKVIHQKNGGVASARNRGIDETTGSYIAFVDSDDWVDERYIEILMQGIERYGGNVAACGFTKVDKIGKITELKTGTPVFYRVAQKELLNHWSLRRTIWGKIYRKDLLSGHRFLSTIRLADDTLFNLDVICHADNVKIYETDLPLYYWYMRENSITHRVNLTNYLDFSRWYVEHPDESEQTGYEWVLRLAAIKLAISGRFYAGFEKKNIDLKKEADSLLQQMIPGMIKSQYMPNKLKIIHLAMAKMPGAYHVYRLMDDSTMWPKERQRIKEKYSIHGRVKE